ncbi:cytochrome P450 protein [Rutstroemia sp. NJR-2017a WRK4]|nr:cytochrome P450 protein [Rutstroemia sp. NJR-2017a WRK4]
MVQAYHLVFAVVSGVTSHLTVFIWGEWRLWTWLVICTYLFLAFLVFSVRKLVLGFPLLEAATWILEFGAVHITALFSSIVIYRVFFHRLRKFRGPFWASVTKFWHVWKCRTSQNHLVLDEVRAQYGNIIRTGPNELTIFDPSAPSTFNDGFNNPCTRPAWYDFLYPLQALISMREKKRHIVRRRIWDRGFSTSALYGYQPKIQQLAEELEEHIASSYGAPIDMDVEIHWFSYDIMGYFAFAQSFSMRRDRKWHHAVKVMREGPSLLGYLTPVPWLGQLAFNFKILPPVQKWTAMVKWCQSRMSERLQVSSWLIKHSVEQGTLDQDMSLLSGDAILMTIAGRYNQWR